VSGFFVPPPVPSPELLNDVDLLGTTLDSYAKNIIADVVSLGRAGTLIDWQGGKENRAYVAPTSPCMPLSRFSTGVRRALILVEDLVAANLDHYRLNTDYTFEIGGIRPKRRLKM
jgi:hypothetical protein